MAEAHNAGGVAGQQRLAEEDDIPEDNHEREADKQQPYQPLMPRDPLPEVI
jgi:hypothetical protein